MADTNSNPTSEAYTRYELSNFVKAAADYDSQSFAVYDDISRGVAVITTSARRGWKWPMEQVSIVSREEARKIWARSLAKGLKPTKPFRQDCFGPIPAKAA